MEKLVAVLNGLRTFLQGRKTYLVGVIGIVMTVAIKRGWLCSGVDTKEVPSQLIDLICQLLGDVVGLVSVGLMTLKAGQARTEKAALEATPPGGVQ